MAAGDTNVTVVCAAGKSVKLVPVITTTHPAGPLVGENDVMVGTAAPALGIAKNMKTAAETVIRMTGMIRLMLSTPSVRAGRNLLQRAGGARDRRG